ncbi:MAG: FecR domain-containing protein [Planctomycetes bacterium]|jgi:ferric-dicitrate binding protein FerR (iron transport regulator)|nr:FecR domain-containing protein [Planctomycetota bacterium]
MSRVRELLMRYEEDILSEAEEQELIAALEHDPAARRLLVGEWSLSCALGQLLSQRASPGKDGWRRHTARHLAARRPRPTRHRVLAWWPVAAAAALLVIVAGWWITRGPDAVATVLMAEGGGPPAGSALAPGSSLSLPAGARVRLRLANGSEVTISQQADLRLPDAQHLMLERGHADLEITPRPSGAPSFRVSTPHGTTRVLGTSFSLSVTAEETLVQVAHGRVQVERDDGTSTAAAAGQRAVLRADRLPVTLPQWRADQREALLITGQPDLDAGERRLLVLLSGMGLKPRVVLAGALEERDVAQARLAVLCNRIALPDLEKRLRHPRCPLVIMEQGAWPLYGFPVDNLLTVTLAEPLRARVARAHALTTGLDATLILAEAGSRIGRGLPSSATLLSQTDGGHALLAVRDPGERLPNGSISPHRRVAFFATTDALPKLTPAGEQVLSAALRWAAELDSP